MSETDVLYKPGVLYNQCYGGFGFSSQCKEEYTRRTGQSVRYEEGLRTDPVMITLFLEKGSKWMSGRYAELAFHEVPEALLEFIHVSEYDGKESVGLHLEAAESTYLTAFRRSVNADQTNLHECYATLCAKLDALIAARRDYEAMCERRRAQRSPSSGE